MFLKKKNIIFLVFLGIAIITLLLYQTKKADVVQIGGAFKLTNHHGKSVSTKNFENNFLLVFFGFTNCPDFCPNTLNNISAVMQQLDEKSNDIIPLFIIKIFLLFIICYLLTHYSIHYYISYFLKYFTII